MAYKIGIKKETFKIPDYCDKKLAQLIRDCWKYEPSERPSFKEIYDRLKNLNSDLIENLF
jgi:hypothetical protein